MFRKRFRVFQIVSYQLNYISNDPPTDGGVYFDHLKQFGISFKTFQKIPRNVSCFPDCFILGEASLRCTTILRKLTQILIWCASAAVKDFSGMLCKTD